MTKLREDEKPNARPNPVETALQIGRLTREIETAYVSTLERLVLSNEKKGGDRKDTAKYARVLKSSEAELVLLTIWSESQFVTDDAREASGLRAKSMGQELSVWGLAIRLAENAQNLAATNSRVRLVCLAAEYFGLIERTPQAQTRVSIRATKALHELLLAVSAERNKILAKWPKAQVQLEPR